MVFVQRGVGIAISILGIAIEHPIGAFARLVDGVVWELATLERQRLTLLPQRPVGLLMERVFHVIACRVALRAILRCPCCLPLDVVVEGGERQLMVTALCRRFVVGYGEVVNLRGVIFGTCQLIPLACVHVIAHAHIHNARFKTTANGLAAIDRVGGSIEPVAEDAEVGTFLVLHGVVKLNGDVASVGSEVNQLLVSQALRSRLTHLLVRCLGCGSRERVDKLSRGGMQLHHGDLLCLC